MRVFRMCSLRTRSFGKLAFDKKGQATVEAALSLPIIFLLLLILLQPCILLYDYLVMQQAAADACRLLITQTSSSEDDYEATRQATLKSLGALPPHEFFHVHNSAGCSYVIAFQGSGQDQTVTVTISNKVRFLPLLDVASRWIGMTDEAGYFTLQAKVTVQGLPAWAQSYAGTPASSFIGEWNEDE